MIPETQIPSQLTKSKVALVLVEKLTTPMAFSLIMILILGFFGKSWAAELGPTSFAWAFWLWFIVTLSINVVGVYLLVQDAKITFMKLRQNSN
ncbi:hypothetical protein ACFTRE_15510 [Bacillus subtilis]|uniref:hypothetical protein n=1 Tax=Bacillus TaxID=1386 RepID=UPI00189DB183|nr:hypothetical protein [Bacillus subtilis]MED1819632.1 hypothetical protein [Bacillus subtilis]QPF46887.1 hypothetical protein GO004_21035 [Bacillus subtilis]